MLWSLNVLVEVKSIIISSFWSAALVILVHRNFLRECCNLVDQWIPEGMHHQPPSGLPHLVYSFGLNIPHTQIRPISSLLVDWYAAHTVQKFLASTAMFCFYDFMFLLQWNGWHICQIIIWNWPIIPKTGRLHWGVELQSSLVSSFWSWSTVLGGYNHAA